MYWQSTANDRGVLYTEFKYALRLQAIIDAIETDYGLQFSNDFLITHLKQIFIICICGYIEKR